MARGSNRSRARREARQESAAARQAASAALTPQVRLANLDKLGLVAKKERAKLQKLIVSPKKASK